MARIEMDSIKRIEKERNSVHSKVYATYTSFISDDEKYVQIDTYGRPERDNPEKISQSLQFDKESALFFVKVLVQEYNLPVSFTTR